MPSTASGSRRGRKTARSRSRFSRAMNSSGISFGHTASHSAWLVQLPNSSRSIAATMFSVRSSRSGSPCGSTFRCVTLAAVKSIADAFGHAATQRRTADAGGGVHRRLGGFLRDQDDARVRGPSGVNGDVAAGLDDPVERRAIDHQVLDDREGLGTPRLERQGIAVLEKSHVKLAHGGAPARAVGHAVDQETARPADALAAIVVEGHRLLAAADQLFVQDVEHLQE